MFEGIIVSLNISEKFKQWKKKLWKVIYVGFLPAVQGINYFNDFVVFKNSESLSFCPFYPTNLY